MVGALLLLLQDAPAEHDKPRVGFYLPALLTCSLLLPVGLIYTISSIASPETPHWAAFAQDLQRFALAHPGTYAMGDCAGTTGYVIPQPLIQTEGLVMDAAFLNNIRQQRDLRDVLASYGVRYYITPAAEPAPGSCFRVEEPVLGGPSSPRMRTILCQAPVATYPVGGVALRIFELSPGAAPMRFTSPPPTLHANEEGAH